MAIEKKPRNLIPEQDPAVRAHNFDEVTVGFDLNLARDEASRCLRCAAAPCMKGCPVGVRIPEFLAKVREGKIEEAGEIIKSTNSLPSVCGRVCPQENQCEKMCVRARIDGAVSIGGVERFVGDYMLSAPAKNAAPESIGKRVAVVGSRSERAYLRVSTRCCGRGSYRLRSLSQDGRRTRLRNPRIPPSKVARRKRSG